MSLIERNFSNALESLKVYNAKNFDKLTLYRTIFSEECRVVVENLHSKALREMKNVELAACEDLINSLDFIQMITAKALWKFKIEVGGLLEHFARDFDRLDVPAERRRLYYFAQSYEA